MDKGLGSQSLDAAHARAPDAVVVTAWPDCDGMRCATTSRRAPTR